MYLGLDIQNVRKLSFAGGGTQSVFLDEDDLGGATTDNKGAASQQSIKAYVDSYTGLNTAYSTTLIKVMPTEFMLSNGRYGNQIDDSGVSPIGYAFDNNAADPGYAFVRIPSGYKATHVQVHSSSSVVDAVTPLTYNYTTGVVSTLVSGDFDFNEVEAITEVTGGLTTDLVIKITCADISTLIYGASVTIAAV